jgi:RNA polymerase sigma factor (sigma-70 family)
MANRAQPFTPLSGMTETNAFQDLIGRIRAGDEDAAAELVRLYEPAIRRAARIRLADSNLRRLLDSMDISQSVFASFFVRAALGQYELDKPEHLLSLLVAMSRRKLADHVRQQAAARRDYRRTGVLAERGSTAAGASPSQQVATQELVQEFRKRLSPDERRLAEQRALGRSWAQIAAGEAGSPEALRKKLARAIDRISQELGLNDFTHE